ncbi:retrovirus-related pol polyprotein from transposon TNT 1-94 [Tanacetum coccineum]
MKEIFKQMEAEVDQNALDKKSAEIKRKNLLIENENLIVECLSKEVFYTTTNYVLTVSRFFEMHDAYSVVQARCLELEAEISKLKHKIQKDDHSEVIKRFSNLEVNHLNLQLKYQHLKESFGNNKSRPTQDAPEFDSVFEINKMKASLQGKDKTIRKLKVKISQLKETQKVTVLQEQNEFFRAENVTIKQHYKELYDNIKITSAKTVEKTTALLAKNENLKAQIIEKIKCIIMDSIKPKVLAPGVISSTEASGSKPMRNTKNTRILPAKSDNKKKVEDHLRNNKLNLKQKNRVDSSISSKHTIINSNSNSVCKTCNKCLIYANHDKCVVKYLTFVNAPTIVKDTLSTVKQVWKETGKLFVNVVQIVLWYLDSGCSKDMTGNRSRLMNFVKKFIETIIFENDHFGAIMSYGDYLIGDSVISKVYYVEGLGHNLFSVGQFCDLDLQVAFRKHSCYVRNEDDVDLLKGSRGLNLYTIFVEEMMKSSPICFLSKTSKNQSWLWHRQLNHFNFGTINDLARKDLVRGLPRLKFEKDHLCSTCQLGKSKKVYILVIVDDYSRFTWVKFLRSKDETQEFVIKFLKQIQVGLNKTVRYIRTDNGTEFNDVVERQNQTIVEAAQTMLIFSKALMFLWAEAVATTCYTQNRSPINTRHNKTPYELVHDKRPDLKFL